VASLDPSKCSVTHLDDVIWTVCTAAARSVTGLLNVTTTGCSTPTTGRFSALSQARRFSTDRSYDGPHVTDCRLPKGSLRNNVYF
jgi:hypothetical protein